MEWNYDAEWEANNAPAGVAGTSIDFQLSILFLVVFVISFLGCYMAVLLPFIGLITEDIGKISLKVLTTLLLTMLLAYMAVFMPAIVGQRVVVLFKMRCAFALRCTAYPAAIAGSGMAIYAIYAIYWCVVKPIVPIFPALQKFVDKFTTGILPPYIILPLITGFIAGEIICARSKFLFSEKTKQWLVSYGTRKRFSFVSPIESSDDITIDSVLHSQPGKKRGKVFTLTLFLDSISDSEHFLTITGTITETVTHRENSVWLKFKKAPPFSVTLPITGQQVELVSEKCGPFRKTWFTVPSCRDNVRQS